MKIANFLSPHSLLAASLALLKKNKDLPSQYSSLYNTHNADAWPEKTLEVSLGYFDV